MESEVTSDVIKVLVVDDDRKLCKLIKNYLEPMGYEVTTTHDGESGLKEALNGEYNVMILDVMMPGLDGFEVLKELRKQSDLPVLMLTARGEELDRIVGLEIGADDYLPKTFSTRELLARLRAVTRRSFISNRDRQTADNDQPLEIGDIKIFHESRTVELNDEPLGLTPIEYNLLLCLTKAAGRVLTRDQILDKVFDRDYEVFDRSIDVHISALRKKIGDDPRKPQYIQTVRSAGYMIKPPLTP
jgi:two-component system, OmpR family, response regulator CpxR